MKTVDFRAVASLINKSVYTTIGIEPSNFEKDKWALYEGCHNPPPGFEYPFYVLYIYSDATKNSIDNAAKALLDRSRTIVVYAPSLDNNTHYHHELFSDGTSGLYTTRDYLLAFVKDKINTYQNALKSITARYYVDPHFEVPRGIKRKFPNPLQLLLNYDKIITKDSDEGNLVVLLAEPGQGKTFQTKYLASTLSEGNVIPIFIQSEQWYDLALNDLSSIWKTVTHSFKYFQCPIDWIEGYEQEFLDITLRSGLFTIIFDGFDEYILWNHGSVNAMDVLSALSELARNTGALILLTSRTSFWNSDLVDGAMPDKTLIYKLLPFDRNNAGVYFKKRFRDMPTRVDRALAIFDELRKSTSSQAYGDLSGRGFVLYHIADIVERTQKNPTITTKKSSVLQWIMTALCEREYKRQKLPINAREQIELFRYFAEEISRGSKPNTSTLKNIISVIFSDKLTENQIEDLVKEPKSGKRGSLQDHPLINKIPNRDRWEFVQEQIRFCLLAEQILNYAETSDKTSLKLFLDGISYTGSLYTDIATAIVDQICTAMENVNLREKFRWIVGLLIECCDAASLGRRDPKRNLATTIAVLALNRLSPPGTNRQERTREFVSFFPDSSLRKLLFSGTIASMDFSGVTFSFCFFDQVAFANCVFDDNTVFDDCSFSGGKLISSPTFGMARWEKGWFDLEASSLIKLARISAGRKEYTREELIVDIQYVVNKFIPREGLFVMVSEGTLSSGTVAHSPHRNTIIKSLTKWVLGIQKTSSSSEKAYYVKEEARDAVMHYYANGVLTGPVAEAFEEIRKKLKMR